MQYKWLCKWVVNPATEGMILDSVTGMEVACHNVGCVSVHHFVTGIRVVIL
jgi:hypothetical protein